LVGVLVGTSDGVAVNGGGLADVVGSALELVVDADALAVNPSVARGSTVRGAGSGFHGPCTATTMRARPRIPTSTSR
jgi:hypothetical protein